MDRLPTLDALLTGLARERALVVELHAWAVQQRARDPQLASLLIRYSNIVYLQGVILRLMLRRWALVLVCTTAAGAVSGALAGWLVSAAQ